MIIKHSKRKLSPARVKELASLARRIDAEEGGEIRARAREVFRRHEQLRAIVEDLKAHRQREGISLAEVARRCGISKPNLSRLENNRRAAPKLETLQRYALAMGKVVSLHLETAAAA
jgi:DNA-binding XRE family transcriptional regulator